MEEVLNSRELARLLVDPTPDLQQALDNELALANCLFTKSANLNPLWVSEVDRCCLCAEVADFANQDPEADVENISIANSRMVSLGQKIINGSTSTHDFNGENWNGLLEKLADSTSTDVELWKAADCTNGQNPYGHSIEYRYFQHILDHSFNPVYGQIKDGSISVDRLSNWLRNVATLVEYRVAEVKGKIDNLYREVYVS